jgi:hypothetical protein
VDLPGGQRGEGLGQPGGDRARVVHLLPGRQRGQVQLGGQLVGGELILRPSAAVAGGELPHRGRQGPGVAGFHPPGRGDDPHQLVIRAPGQPFAFFAGDGVHHRGQQRAGRHGVRPAALREPGQGQLPGGQAHVQALPQARAVPGRAVPVLLRPRTLPGRGEPPGSSPSGPGSENRSWGMHRRPFGRKLGSKLRTHSITY